ncbi:hypothetical protein [Halorussus pelagicus]|uniref:hypothetical protein n=1 Tax=Halorussus pelagicus TaxID=2505977 RepID=UPI000FFBEB70|nr:hypothetical protein [Halorussus pelagicus]
MLRGIQFLFKVLLLGIVFLTFAPSLLGRLGNKAAGSRLIESGAWSMGPLDNFAWLVLEILPIAVFIGCFAWVLLAVVAKLGLAGRQ